MANPLADCIPSSFALSFILLLMGIAASQAQTCPNFYDSTCPRALSTIRHVIRTAVSREPRMGASLIRLHFHDCFVQGCDASILLDDTASIVSEQNAKPNIGSVRGYQVIEKAKSEVEKICPGVVSCADVLTLAARDATYALGGPYWTVKLGRRDSTTANISQANTDLPKPTDDLNTLITKFNNKGLSAEEMVVLSGAHTVGRAQCTNFRTRIYNSGSDSIDAQFASTRQQSCPLEASTQNDRRLAPLDFVTPNYFDNSYFKNLIHKKGLLQSDQVLFNGGSTDSIVSGYSQSPTVFKSDFAAAMIKMGDIQLLTGSSGIIRKICSSIN